MNTCSPHEAGFTILEILVAIAIMGFIMVLVQGTSKQMLDSKERVEQRDLLFQDGRVALRKISDDLAGAFLIRKNPAAALTTAGVPPVGSPTVRSVPRPITFFVGQDAGGRDIIRFTTLSHLRLMKNAKESDQAKVEYHTAPSPTDSRLFDVVRVEEPWIDERTEVSGKGQVLAEGVREFHIEYYDIRKEEWTREWNTEVLDWSDKLPSAVRITIAFPDPDDSNEAIKFSTGLFLPLSGGPIDF